MYINSAKTGGDFNSLLLLSAFSAILQLLKDDLEFHHTKEVCPMCDSDLLLTEEGVAEEEKRSKDALDELLKYEE